MQSMPPKTDKPRAVPDAAPAKLTLPFWRTVAFQKFLREGATLALFYGLPFYVLGRTVASLTGGALWLPPAWRNSLVLLVTAIGGCCFVAARSFGRDNGFRWRGPTKQPGKRSKTAPSSPAAVGRPTCRWRCHAVGGLALVVALLALSFQFELRHRYIRSVVLPHGEFARVLLHETTEASQVPWTDELGQRLEDRQLPEGQYLQRADRSLALRLIVPPRHSMSSDFGQLLDEWELRYGEAALTRGAHEELGRLLDVLESDPRNRRATSNVIHTFLALHLLIILAASLGYGVIYALLSNPLEEVADQAGNLMAALTP